MGTITAETVVDFNPLSPHGERREALAWPETPAYFNPLSPHGERLGRSCCCSWRRWISIHSPRMGRDPEGEVVYLYRQISIHSPRMGRDDTEKRLYAYPLLIFQSTLPAWGETSAFRKRVCCGLISIHSPRMGRDTVLHYCKYCAGISIHSPRMRRDSRAVSTRSPAGNFNPTLPAWERPPYHVYNYITGYFNPLSPHGERRNNLSVYYNL